MGHAVPGAIVAEVSHMILQVNAEGVFRYCSVPWFSQALHLLAASGVHGVAVDVWVSELYRDQS